MAMTDALYRASMGRDIETPRSPHGDATLMRPQLFTRRNDSLHEVAGLKTMNAVGGFGSGTRETELIHPTHLPGTASSGLDD